MIQLIYLITTNFQMTIVITLLKESFSVLPVSFRIALFDPVSLIGSAGSSAIILTSSTECNAKFWTRACNWVTGLESSQFIYCSKLAGVILALTILDVLVQHSNITEGAVTIVSDGKIDMDESRAEWPFSIHQNYFDYLQVICAWIKSSPLTFHFRHVKGHQTKIFHMVN